jgi:hypothetical protein
MSIGSYAFENCKSLTSVVIGDSVTSIGDEAFYNCTALTEIQYNATELADLSEANYVFYKAGQNREGITVTIGANVKKIPAYIFCPYNSTFYAPKITKVVFEEGSVCESIGDHAFYFCSSLKSIEIPDSVYTILPGAFLGCSALTEVILNEGLRVIQTAAFNGAPLKCLEIPSTVERIDISAFSIENGGTIFIKKRNSILNTHPHGSFNFSVGDKSNTIIFNTLDSFYMSNPPIPSGGKNNTNIYTPMTTKEWKRLGDNPLGNNVTICGIDDPKYEERMKEGYGDLLPKPDDFEYKVFMWDNLDDSFNTLPDAEVCFLGTEDWRTEAYFRGLEANDQTFSKNYYSAELTAEWPKIYDMRGFRRERISLNEEDPPLIAWYMGKYREELSPENYEFWLDFLEGSDSSLQSGISQFNVSKIGRRTKVVTENSVNCIFASEVPNYIYIEADGNTSDEIALAEKNGQEVIQVSPEVYRNLTLGGGQESAFSKAQDLLVQHTQYAESVSISTIPIYHLEPNTRIRIYDNDLGVGDDYMIKTISLPLTPNGTSSISATKCIKKI